MDDIKRQLSVRIRSLRKKHNFTQEQLSETSGIEYKHIQKIESQNPSDVKLTTLKKLAKAFNLSLSKFLDF